MTLSFTTADTHCWTYTVSRRALSAAQGLSVCEAIQHAADSSSANNNSSKFTLFYISLPCTLYLYPCVCFYLCVQHTAEVNQQPLQPSCPIKLPFSHTVVPPCVVHGPVQLSSLTSSFNYAFVASTSWIRLQWESCRTWSWLAISLFHQTCNHFTAYKYYIYSAVLYLDSAVYTMLSADAMRLHSVRPIIAQCDRCGVLLISVRHGYLFYPMQCVIQQIMV